MTGELIFLVLNNESGILQSSLVKLFHKGRAQGSISQWETDQSEWLVRRNGLMELQM